MPLVPEISPCVKPTGASEKVKVTFELLSLSLSDVSTMSNATVGFLVSSVTESWVAATLSLSAGDSDAALGHVRRALDQEPASHHAHYMMAVIHSTRAETAKAVEHLRRAIELNPDSRSLARQDADLERLRESPTVKSLLEETTPDLKGRARARR